LADNSSPQPQRPRPRTNVYIDGFNFYYGAVKDTPHKWLDFQRFVRFLRPADDVQRIYYFTALVDAPSPQKRQLTYLGALGTLPNIEVVLGRFKSKQIKCEVAACSDKACDKIFKKPEEKRTDVNIAVYMVDHAYQNACDQFVLISGDSDLVPAVRMIKLRFPEKLVIVYVPAKDKVRAFAVELRGSADRHRELPLNLLQHAQLPSRVPDGAGGVYEKPPTW
jgi:uncharacterized LabA/DUF88 family protein